MCFLRLRAERKRISRFEVARDVQLLRVQQEQEDRTARRVLAALIDHLLLSKPLAPKQTAAGVGREVRIGKK
jgi:hypothetical protein